MSIARARLLGLAAAAALLVPACGPRGVEAPRVDDSDYVYPDPPRGLLKPADDKAFRAAWNDVLIGQADRAETTGRRLLAAYPRLSAARVLLGFAALRAERFKDAEAILAAALKAEPDSESALVGLASVKRRLGLLEEALPLYSRAARLRPRDSALARRAGEVKLQVAEAAMARASSLAAEGRKNEAMAMLGKALEVAPELASVRLELVDQLVQAGRRAEALTLLAAAPEADRSIALRTATLRLEDGDLAGAQMALERGIRDVSEDPEAAALLLRIRDRRATLALPEPLRAIGEAARITRAELAALVVSRVTALSAQKATVAEVASDVSRSWARPQVLRAIELGLMDVYPNHTFQPGGIVRRGELATVAARVLDLLNWGRTAGPGPRDMSPSHLQYRSVVRVLGAGLMQNTPSGAFEPWRIVSGAEAKAVVDGLATMSSSR